MEEMIRRVNPFAMQLATLGQTLAAAMERDPASMQKFILSILDHRPAPGQVCAFFESNGNDPPNPALCGIWIRTEGNQLHRIDLWNPNADMLLYPVIFPRATQTYGRGIPRHSKCRTRGPPKTVEDLLDTVDGSDDEGDPFVRRPYETESADGGDVANAAPADTQPLHFPTEPSNWNDDVEVVDVEIPDSEVRPAAEVVDLAAFLEPEEIGADGHLFTDLILHSTGTCRENVDAFSLMRTSACFPMSWTRT